MSGLVIIQKPPFRAPCNRCGECCRAGPCNLALDFLDASEDAQCSALEIEADGKFSCGLFKRPEYYVNPQMERGDLAEISILIGKFLAFGQGCGMEDR